jgi:ubiquitin carboxyl-terminal hydrolase L3
MEGNFKWPPLESDPSIFTEYAHKLGLSENYSFEEILSLDYKEVMGEITNPVYSVIVSYEAKTKLELNQEKLKSPHSVPFFMVQTEILDNACGLIAILHSIGNNQSSINLDKDTVLNKFFAKVKSLKSEEKSKELEDSEGIKGVHNEFANQGQSELCEEQDDVKNHFIAFTYHDQKLFQFDGLKTGPYVIEENIKFEDLLDSAIKEIKRRLENDEISENLSIIYLTSF